MKPVLRFAWRVLRAVLLGLTAVVLLVEQWGWRPLAALAARLSRWAPVAWLEARIKRAPRYVALVLFLVPALLLLPVKIAALWLIQQDHAVLGLGVIVAAKVLGTAFVGRLFVLLEPQLMGFAWFARTLAWWQGIREPLLAKLHASLVWRGARAIGRSVRLWLRRRPT